jgi:hypothetical protein
MLHGSQIVGVFCYFGFAFDLSKTSISFSKIDNKCLVSHLLDKTFEI